MHIERLDAEIPVGEAIVWALADAGVRYVLTLPGGYVGPILDALHDHPTIRTVQVREESIGTAMAEAYGRLTGEPIAVLGQGQWISGVAGAGLLESLLGSSPVLVLTEMTDGGPFSHNGNFQAGDGEYGTWDARTALSGISKSVMTSRFPAQAVQHVQLGLKHALSGEPGPAVVIFHGSSLKGTVGPATRPRIYGSRPYLVRPRHSVDELALADAVDALTRAQSPVVIAGNGVRVAQATTSLARLSAALDVPVMTSAGGKGVFDETDPRAAGMIGMNGLASAHDLLSAADLILAVGTKLAPNDTLREHPDLIDPTRQVLIQVDVEPLNASWTYPVHHVLEGDAGFVMDRISDAFETPPTRPVSATERIVRARSAWHEFDLATFESDTVPFRPERIIRTLEESVTDDAIITLDAGENRLFMMHWFRNRRPGGYLQPAGSGQMAYSIRAAMGAKLAFPDAPAIAVCGDGGFSMNLHSLLSSVQEKLPVAVVIFNNSSLSWVVHAMGDRAVAGDLMDVDYAAVARSLGCDGVRPASVGELRTALEKASGPLERTFVIDVPTSMETTFKDVEVRSLLKRQETSRA